MEQQILCAHSTAAGTQQTCANEKATVTVDEVIMVYKNHLDIGFTEPVFKMTHDAIFWMLGEAIKLDERAREHGLRFVWTVPSWVIWEALEISSGKMRESYEKGIAEGSLAWHAMPFTPHTELMDTHLLEATLSLSKMLDERFGKITKAAKFTDVPGHCVGLVPVLADAEIDLLHIGINHMSSPCKLPEAFRWRHEESGKEIVVLYNEHSYGGNHVIGGDRRALAWKMIGDNCEVPTINDVLADRRDSEALYPQAKVRVGRLDDYLGDDFISRTRNLPVVTKELGDSWIHGTGSDPWKTIRMRSLQRLAKQWLQEKKIVKTDKAYIDFAKNMFLMSEHTWGINFNAFNLHDNTNWNNSEFHALRKRGYIRVIEGCWQEQRDYLKLACDSLPQNLQQEAKAAMQAASPWDGKERVWEKLDVYGAVNVPRGAVMFDSKLGYISSYLSEGKARCAGALGQYRYQTFDSIDCERFCASYNRGEMKIEEFTKEGLSHSDAQSRWWYPQATGWSICRDADDVTVRCELEMPPVAHQKFGAPQAVHLLYHFSGKEDRVDFYLQWQGKTATRLPEASWWSFDPVVDSPRDWRLDKCGTWVDPYNVIEGGGRELHGVQTGARNRNLMLSTPDAHLIAPGKPQLYRFNEQEVDCSGGMHLNLHNNCWGTNFVMWFEDDVAFHASLKWE